MTLRAVALYCLSVALLQIFSSAFAAEEDRITLGLTTRAGSSSLPFVLAEEMGFFRREGLNVVVVIMQNQVVVNGVLTRNVDYGGTFSNFVGAALSGLPTRIVMAVMDGCDHILVTSPNVKRVEDLRGKIIGISSFGGTPHSEALTILRKYGINPQRDVTFMQIGGSSQRYAALESGAIHGAMLIPPFNKIAYKKGFNELLSFNDVMRIPCAGVAVQVDKMREKPDEIVKIIKATLKSMDFIRNRKEEITSFMEKKWGIKDADVRQGIYGDIAGLYSRTGIAAEEGMKNVIQMVQEARKMKGTVAPAEITDWSYARRANDELKGR